MKHNIELIKEMQSDLSDFLESLQLVKKSQTVAKQIKNSELKELYRKTLKQQYE